MTAALDQGTLRAELASTWLDGLEGDRRAEGEALIEQVVADWAQEADSTPNPQAVLRFQREDLEALGAGRDAAGRLDALRLRVLGRRVDRVAAETLALGQAVLDGSVADDEARERGRELLGRCEQLADQLAVRPPSPELVPMRRALHEAMMDALFAVERQAHSPRLLRLS